MNVNERELIIGIFSVIIILGFIVVQIDCSSYPNDLSFIYNESTTSPFINHDPLDPLEIDPMPMTVTGIKYMLFHNLRQNIDVYNSINSLTGDFSDYGLDSDGDGRFNYLCINVGVNITQERDLFYLDMELRSVIGDFLFIKRIHNSSLNLGRNTLSVPFNVFDPSEINPTISLFQLNTSYRIDYVEFGYLGNSGATYYPINQIYGSPFTTRVYNYTEFDSPESNPNSSVESKTTSTLTTTSNRESIPSITPGFKVIPFLMIVLIILAILRRKG